MAQELAADTYRSQLGEVRPHSGLSLSRTTTWGVLATMSLALAVISAYSSPRRPTAADIGSAQSRRAEPGGVDANTQRLIEAVRALAAEREQLLARIASLEASLGDVTDSIKRESAPASQHPLPELTSLSSGAGAPALAMPASPPEIPAVLGAATPNVSALTPASQTTIQSVAVAAPDSNGRGAAASSNPVTAALGVDVGGSRNFESLRTVWTSIKRSNVALPEEVYPVVLARESNKLPGADLRLIIGPFSSAEVAARLCSALLAEHRYCQPVAFEGQRLSVVRPAPNAGLSVRSSNSDSLQAQALH